MGVVGMEAGEWEGLYLLRGKGKKTRILLRVYNNQSQILSFHLQT